jgi:hypothetical protein
MGVGRQLNGDAGLVGHSVAAIARPTATVTLFVRVRRQIDRIGLRRCDAGDKNE